MNEHYTIHEYQGDPGAWRQVLYDVYKPQASTVLDRRQVGGRIRQWSFGAAEVTDYECSPMRFLREARHVGPGCEDHYFISMPYLAGCMMSLTQEGRTARCAPGHMILQHTARPSELVHPTVGAIIVRVPGSALRERFRNTPGCLGLSLPAVDSAGALVFSLATSLVANATNLAPAVKQAAGESLIDLLAIALEAQAGDLPRSGKAVRDAHYARAERFIQHHFREPDLAPAAVARACGISVGYLHELFRDHGTSVAETIMETRLLAAMRLLRAVVGAPKSVSEVAFHCGFSDAAHFSRRFSRRYGAPPREFLGGEQAGGLSKAR